MAPLGREPDDADAQVCLDLVIAKLVVALGRDRARRVMQELLLRLRDHPDLDLHAELRRLVRAEGRTAAAGEPARTG